MRQKALWPNYDTGIMIDTQLQQQLRQRFNPDGSTLRAMQMRMLDILKYVDRMCAENGIKYWLSSGTCLGAIRHGGFIPWDDDVDIEMLAADYDRLRQAVMADPDAPFAWHDSKTDRNFFFPFAKIRDKQSELIENSPWNHYYNQHGIYIDVFRLYPSSSLMIENFANAYHHRMVLGVARRRHNPIAAAILRPAYWIMEGIISPVCRRLVAINARGQLRHRIGSEFPKARRQEDVNETERVPFEGIMLPVPKGYDSYLRRIYGDYMSLPNLDKIEPHTAQVKFHD